MFPAQVSAILERLEQAGFAAYAVGGCVRDTLLGRVPQDWDVATSARPEQTAALFAGRSIPTGLQHGTVTVRQEGLSVEVTTFRADGPYSDHRRPDAVYFSDSLAEDLCRRDLTVNAMAMDRRGVLTDLHGGREDLRRGLLRCVGEPDRRFDEDALRIMRTLRFASVLGFTVEERTAAALHRRAPLLGSIAAERLLSEMDRLLCGRYVLPVLLAYPDVLGVFLPELLPCVGFDQRNRHHLYDVWGHTSRAVAAVPPEPVLRWTMLLHDVGKPPCFTVDDRGVGHFYGHPKVSAELAETACRRLRMDKRTAHQVVTLVQWHDRDIPRTEKAIARAVHQLGEGTFRQLLAGGVSRYFPNYLKSPAEYYETLTETEKKVLRLMALGMSNDEIAERMGRKAGTIKFHSNSIFRKLRVSNRQQAVNRGRGIGLLRHTAAVKKQNGGYAHDQKRSIPADGSGSVPDAAACIGAGGGGAGAGRSGADGPDAGKRRADAGTRSGWCGRGR